MTDGWTSERQTLIAALQRTITSLELMSHAASQALEAWRRPPRPSEPLPDDPRFKRWIAESPSSAPELARIYGLSTRTIHRWRSQYS